MDPLAERVGELDDPQAVTTMSSRTLKPCVESLGAIFSTSSRPSMKNPLIGSLSLSLSRWCASLVARRLPRARCEDSAAAEPPSA
jgi:hypothetical protein